MEKILIDNVLKVDFSIVSEVTIRNLDLAFDSGIKTLSIKEILNMSENSNDLVLFKSNNDKIEFQKEEGWSKSDIQLLDDGVKFDVWTVVSGEEKLVVKIENPIFEI
jgi:hypothetical protein